MNILKGPQRWIVLAVAIIAVAAAYWLILRPAETVAQPVVSSVDVSTPGPHLILTLKDGTVDIALLQDVAPLHVEQIKTLTERGDYDGVVFHRVIEDFMAQTGDVQFGKTGSPDFNMGLAGSGDSDLPNVKAEFNAESFTRGAVGAARTNDPNSFNSQFFICFKDCTFLDGNYTVFGRVVSGMEFVDNITRGEPPATPDTIISAKIENR